MTDHWIVPGGGVEPNEDASDAAIRETEEEAGVRGSIKRCLGDFEVRDEHKERKHRTSVYVLEVSEELEEYDDCKSKNIELSISFIHLLIFWFFKVVSGVGFPLKRPSGCCRVTSPYNVRTST